MSPASVSDRLFQAKALRKASAVCVVLIGLLLAFLLVNRTHMVPSIQGMWFRLFLMVSAAMLLWAGLFFRSHRVCKALEGGHGQDEAGKLVPLWLLLPFIAFIGLLMLWPMPR